MKSLRILLSGFGNVGRAFTRRILDREKELLKRYNTALVVVGIVDSKGAAVNVQGFSNKELFELLNMPRGHVSDMRYYGRPNMTTVDVLNDVDVDVLVEVTPSNYETGNPGLKNVLTAINKGVHVVLANKAPLALKFGYIMDIARSKGVMVGYKATVMAGTPLIDMLQYGLVAQHVKSIEGILNASTNYILTVMHKEGITLKEAICKAMKLGILEPDYVLDVDGWDPAAKLVIIVNTILKSSYSIRDVVRKSLREVKISDIEEAKRRGEVVKYLAIARIRNREAKLIIKPQSLPQKHSLTKVNGTYNGILIKTDINDIFVSGKGAGPIETASVMISDLVKLAEMYM